MICVVDTSAWAETLVNSEVGKQIAPELPPHADWLVPTIVQFELAKWVKRELDRQTAGKILAFAQTCIIADLDSEIALAAANLATRHRLATADAIIYATAQAFDAALLTCDAHFKGLPGVRYIPKAVN